MEVKTNENGKNRYSDYSAIRSLYTINTAQAAVNVSLSGNLANFNGYGGIPLID